MSSVNPTSEIIDLNQHKETRDKVIKILNLTTNSGWSIVHHYDNIVLVHYDDDADMMELGHIRGIAIDLEKESIIASSFGYTPAAVVQSLTPDDNKLKLVDQNNDVHVFNLDKTIIKPFFEGVVMRVVGEKEKCIV